MSAESPSHNVCSFRWMIVLLVGTFSAIAVFYKMWSSQAASVAALTIGMVNVAQAQNYSCAATADIDAGWYAPSLSDINNLNSVLNGTGVYGFIYDSSVTPAGTPYGTYNWCNSPHTRRQEYVQIDSKYKLEYVEVIHRHHKRTPYAANTFPKENIRWDCDDESLFYFGAPEPEHGAAQIAWQVYQSTSNPLAPSGFNGSCQFPQITGGGLYDSRQHGTDLFGVYHDLLNFIPSTLNTSSMVFRVTNNVITSQVASQVILGMYPATNHTRIQVLIQPDSVDSLEPGYSCDAADTLYSSYGVGSSATNWTAHLTAPQSQSLFNDLFTIGGVNASDKDWNSWSDHTYDRLSAGQCHDKPFPCSSTKSSKCVTQEEANAVYRRGQYEYSWIYRDSPDSLKASTASYGIWIAELAANLRDIIAGRSQILYRHNVAHDGSMARLLSILQVDVMVWPALGSEIVFELFSNRDKGEKCWFIRVLWQGQVLTSSNPTLGRLDMVSVQNLLGYIDALVGVGAQKVPGLCAEA